MTKGTDRAEMQRLIHRHLNSLSRRDTSDAELTRLILELIVGGHRATMESYREQEPKKRGKPRGQTFKGMLTIDAIDYGQQIKRQLKAEGVTYRINWQAAEKAAADLRDSDPCYSNYKDLEGTIYWALRNNR